MTCHIPVTVKKADYHPEPSIGRKLQSDYTHDQNQEGVTVTLKVFQEIFFTAKIPQHHDHDPVHITGKMTNIETLHQRLIWQRDKVRDQDRHWHPIHGTEIVSNKLTFSKMKYGRDH